MMRSLWTGASGMNGQQYNIDTIANNLANVNTNGYKPMRAEFEDLLYQTQRLAGSPATDETVRPLATQVGHGVKVSATQRMFKQGNLKATDNPTDLAIDGEGLLRVMLQDGTYAYTRDGSLKIDANGQLVTNQGYRIAPEIIMPEGFILESLNIRTDGEVSVRLPNIPDPVVVGQMELYRFVNPAGLSSLGENLFKETPASGEVIAGQPSFNGMGRIQHRFFEMSAVSSIEEMVNLIVAQRAYEFNSKTIQTSDNMLGTATQLKR
ncbi:flagellar basal-body rod protein FlgG [Entomospira entomophila]|uniref:Flagellar basal-body rod protein FlgG n=1 Tax=Entomospira entomophila TaxID=2719988 RepID=A0A968GA89_9SPIO|nr:flagellar basal-body rod protein FlgG [Entomospira entomophilus]NIZ40896.1 flagellar basal-body rod protein FlgG [Entomospira entomophilus]WDI35109.1 flagellar basal-body rod protein FlgG [Entomospira entomophilus]